VVRGVMTAGCPRRGRFTGVVRARRAAGADADVGAAAWLGFFGVAAGFAAGWASGSAGTAAALATGGSEIVGVVTGGVETGGVVTGGVVTGGVDTGGVVTTPPIAPPGTSGGLEESARRVTCPPARSTSTVPTPGTSMVGSATVVVATPGTLMPTSAFAAATGRPARATTARAIDSLPGRTTRLPSAATAAKLTALGE
jgi:hypothetical protein